MKAYGEVDLGTTQRPASSSCLFTPGERVPDIHWIGGWVDPRADLDNMEKLKIFALPWLELRRLLGRSARSQSLYRLMRTGLSVWPNTFNLQ
jgi:hypothetical protein